VRSASVFPDPACEIIGAVTADFTTLPRVPLATLPTPLTDAPGLRKALGGAARCPRILLKRDDLTGLALGGNKARKLEFLMADALARRADVVVSSGATQSNHARMTAAAARAVGLDCVLVLSARSAEPPLQGNLLLDRLFGATIHFIRANPDPRFALEKTRPRDLGRCHQVRGLVNPSIEKWSQRPIAKAG